MPTPPRKSIKALPTAEEYRRNRREKYLADAKRRRQAKIEQMRFPYRGQEYYYVIHGHAGVPSRLGGRTFLLPGVSIVFYCADGETTEAARQRNINADWPRLLRRLWTGNTLPDEHIFETISSMRSCQALVVFPGIDIPDHGVYFVCRNQAGQPPHTVTRLCQIPDGSMLIVTLINTVIKPDAGRRGLDDPINIHWIACRAHLS